MQMKCSDQKEGRVAKTNKFTQILASDYGLTLL